MGTGDKRLSLFCVYIHFLNKSITMKKLLFLFALIVGFVQPGMAEKVVSSSVLPTDGRPDHLYTMMNGNNLHANANTAPTETVANFALFAFYPVSGVENAYYIYNYTLKKWLTYDKAGSYSNCTGFVKFSDSQENYFNLNNYADDFYQIAPYNTTSVASKYLNWFQGTSKNPMDGTVTLGLWEQGGASDAGSKWTFSEVTIEEITYTVVAPEGVVVTIGEETFVNGEQYTSENSLKKSDVSVPAADGKFTIISIDDNHKTVTIQYAAIPQQAESSPYTQAVLYPQQQTLVGAAQLVQDGDVYTFSNSVLAASYVKVGDALFFGGSRAMNLEPGTEIFTVAFGAGVTVPASSMTLKSVEAVDLTGDPEAVGGAEHFDGKALVAQYEYTYEGAALQIVWKAVLRDGSHYLRTEMELTGTDDVDMYNVIPLLYNVDTKAAGSAPAVVGNTRGAVLLSDKIFAGLENPVAYNTVGDAAGSEDLWVESSSESVSLPASSWVEVAEEEVPNRVAEATGASYPDVLAYRQTGLTLQKDQKVEVTITYNSGANRLNFGGADLIDSNGNVVANDYHSGYAGNQHSHNVFTFTVPFDGTFDLRVMVEKKSEPVTAASTMTTKVFSAKEGVVVNTDVVGIQGLWSRNTTLAAGETWKISGVVGLVAQDGQQANENIHKTQKRRSFLAYSERERAVPWRANPAYISWYELNINRNNAADPTQNMTAEQVLDVLKHWKEDFYDVYGVGPNSFVIDDGWDNYGTWTFHAGFPNEMRDMADLAAQMGAGVGAWLGPVGGYGTSGNYRRKYWTDQGQKMELSNPNYYATFLAAAENLVKNQGDFRFFKFDGISAQFSAVGPDAGDKGNENAEGIIRLERYVRENLRRDIFFNTTVGTWASPFWYHYTDATWRQENDYGTIGNNSSDRENWITYRDRLVYQNYVSNSPVCPINTLMTHGFILSSHGAVSKDMSYAACLRELRCAFLCGSGMVELYNDYPLMNSIENGKLWGDLAECIKWQKNNADVLPDAHWVGGNPWNGSSAEVYGWAAWNGSKATLALRNGSNDGKTYTFTLREALNIPANVNGSMYFRKSFKVQDALAGFDEGVAIDYDTPITVTLPGSSVFGFDGSVEAWQPQADTFNPVAASPEPGATVESLDKVTLTFPSAVGAVDSTPVEVKNATGEAVTTATLSIQAENAEMVDVTFNEAVAVNGTYRLTIPEAYVWDTHGDLSAEDKGVSNGATYNSEYVYSFKVRVLEDYALNFDRDAAAARTDRQLNSVTLTEEGQAPQTITLGDNAPYHDMTANESDMLTCKQGGTLTVTFNYQGNWMNGYVYVDLDQSKQFAYNPDNTDQTGTELLAFSFYSGNFNDDSAGVNSEGTSLTEGARNVLNPPSFVAPAEPGDYRIRFKVDWNSVDPGGQVGADGTCTGTNGILANGGVIVDAVLRVTGEDTGLQQPAAETVSDKCYDLSGRRITKAPARGVYIQNSRKILK